MAKARKGRRRDKGDGEVEVLPNGNYRARLTRVVNGKRTRGGSKTFPTRRQAQDWIDEHKATGPAAAGTVAEWLEAWLVQHKPEVAAKTFRHDRQRVNRWLIPRLGNVRLRDLDAATIKTALLASMAAEGCSDSERHKAGSVLRKALNAAVELDRLPYNPMSKPGKKGIRLPKPNHAEKEVLTVPQMRDLCRLADVLRMGHWVRLWVDAGLRPGELLGLFWEDIDLARGTVTVRRSLDADTHELKEPKTKRSRRTIPLAATTVQSLKAGAGQGVFVPDGQGGHWWESNFSRDLFKPLVRAAGFGWATPYTLRHSCASALLSSGANLVVVSRRLGHDSPNITLASYAHLMPDDQERAAEIMDRLLVG